MTRKIVLSAKFRREFRKFVRNNEKRQLAAEQAIRLLEIDPFIPLLETHKLSGKYFGSLACSCGYDCRIIFSVENDYPSGLQLVVLTGIGTHNDVY